MFAQEHSARRPDLDVGLLLVWLSQAAIDRGRRILASDDGLRQLHESLRREAGGRRLEVGQAPPLVTAHIGVGGHWGIFLFACRRDEEPFVLIAHAAGPPIAMSARPDPGSDGLDMQSRLLEQLPTSRFFEGLGWFKCAAGCEPESLSGRCVRRLQEKKSLVRADEQHPRDGSGSFRNISDHRVWSARHIAYVKTAGEAAALVATPSSAAALPR